MKEFVMIFRNDYHTEAYQSPEQMQVLMQQWMDWLGGMAAQDKVVSSGNRLGSQGKVVRPGKVVTDGPYTELKEFVGGYIIVRADSVEAAAEMAKECPILTVGGNVEIRDVVEVKM